MIAHKFLARHIPVFIGFVLAIGVANGASATGGERACRTAATEHLQSLGVNSRNIEEVNMVRIIGIPELGNTIEFQGWAVLDSCKGSVVVKLTPLCSPKETYSRGNCDIPNIKHF